MQRETPLVAEGVIVWQNKKVRSLVVVVSPHLSLPLTLSLSLSFVLCGWLLAGSRLLNGTDESEDCQEVWGRTFAGLSGGPVGPLAGSASGLTIRGWGGPRGRGRPCRGQPWAGGGRVGAGGGCRRTRPWVGSVVAGDGRVGVGRGWEAASTGGIGRGLDWPRAGAAVSGLEVGGDGHAEAEVGGRLQLQEGFAAAGSGGGGLGRGRRSRVGICRPWAGAAAGGRSGKRLCGCCCCGCSRIQKSEVSTSRSAYLALPAPSFFSLSSFVNLHFCLPVDTTVNTTGTTATTA